jgi:single-strand DNA-binding protein
MKGIHCAFTGKCGQDAELKTSKSGKPWLSVSVAVDMEASEEATTWVRVAVFGQLATELHPELKKGTEVYCEGRLKLDSWTGRDGRDRSGLSVAASRVEVLGRIGFDPYQRKREVRSPEGQPALNSVTVAGTPEDSYPF